MFVTNEDIQKLYIRVCRDSGFDMGWLDASFLTAQIYGLNPLHVWHAFGSIVTMQSIATGEHPAVNNPVYGAA